MGIHKIKYILPFIFLSCFFKVCFSQSAGAHLTYNWISGNQYLLKLTYFRDCASVSAPDSSTICISSISNSFSNTISLPSDGAPIVLPQLSYLPPSVNSCAGGSSFGVEKYTYSGVVNLPYFSDDWLISFTGSLNLQPFQNPSLFIYTKIDNLNYPQNNGLSFQTNPKFLYCLTQDSWEDYEALDSDGDTIIYSIISPLLDSTICPAQPFISPLYPFYQLPSFITYFIDSLNGWIHFIPNQIQAGFINIKAREIRYGNTISESTFMHYQAAIVGCTPTNIQEYNTNLDPEFFITPTVAKEEIHIKSRTKLIVNISILTMQGINILSEGNIKEQSRTLNISGLNPGVYFIELMICDPTHLQKSIPGSKYYFKFVKV